MAVEETGQPGERQFQGRKVRREARQRCQRLNRPHRFLRCRLGHSQGQEELVHPMTWLQEFCQSLENSDLPLARYFRSTFSLAEVSLTSLGKSNELFPCPPPYPWVHEIVTDPGRSRKGCRWKHRRAVELWVNLMVCGLSFEAVQVEVAPLRGRRGSSLSQAQKDMVSFLRTLAHSVVCLGSKDPGCGLRLPATAQHLEHLREQLKSFEQLPYSSPHRGFESGNRDSSFTATQALPVIAERLSSPEEVSDLAPTPFLSETFQQIYANPNTFLKSPEEMPEPIRVKGTASRKELLKVFGRWDSLGRLYVYRSSEVSPEDRCELFAVAKDATRDRQILHRKRRNLREVHVQGASRDLPHGVMLCQLPLEEDWVCAVSIDDIKDFYHAYQASRAKSSPVGPCFRWSEARHLKAYKQALQEGRLRKGDRVACCFKGLGMGDHAAVDIAQESHTNLLKSFGAMRDEELLKYRLPMPNPLVNFTREL